MKPYSYHVSEQLANEASMSVDTAVDAVSGRYLSAISRGEVERATELARKIRSQNETQAVVTVLEEQRGSNVDILVSLVAAGGSYIMGRAISSVSPHIVVTALPAALGLIASLALPVHYSVRSGIAGATGAYVAGAASNKK